MFELQTTGFFTFGHGWARNCDVEVKRYICKVHLHVYGTLSSGSVCWQMNQETAQIEYPFITHVPFTHTRPYVIPGLCDHHPLLARKDNLVAGVQPCMTMRIL